MTEMTACRDVEWCGKKVNALSEACAFYGWKWPEELTSGVMFFMGQRITRDEFEASKPSKGTRHD